MCHKNATEKQGKPQNINNQPTTISKNTSEKQNERKKTTHKDNATQFYLEVLPCCTRTEIAKVKGIKSTNQ